MSLFFDEVEIVSDNEKEKLDEELKIQFKKLLNEFFEKNPEWLEYKKYAEINEVEYFPNSRVEEIIKDMGILLIENLLDVHKAVQLSKELEKLSNNTSILKKLARKLDKEVLSLNDLFSYVQKKGYEDKHLELLEQLTKKKLGVKKIKEYSTLRKIEKKYSQLCNKIFKSLQINDKLQAQELLLTKKIDETFSLISEYLNFNGLGDKNIVKISFFQNGNMHLVFRLISEDYGFLLEQITKFYLLFRKFYDLFELKIGYAGIVSLKTKKSGGDLVEEVYNNFLTLTSQIDEIYKLIKLGIFLENVLSYEDSKRFVSSIDLSDENIERIGQIIDVYHGEFFAIERENRLAFLKALLENKLTLTDVDLIKGLDLSELEFVNFIQNKVSKDDLKFIIANKFFNLDIVEKIKLVDLRKVINKYDKQVVNLDIETLQFLEKEDIDEELLSKLLANEVTLQQLKKEVEKQKFIQKKQRFLKLVPTFVKKEIELIEEEKIFDKQKNKFEKYYDYFASLSSSQVFLEIYDTLYEVKPKKFKPSEIINILRELEKYSLNQIEGFLNLLQNDKVQITKKFFENYEEYISKIMKNLSFIKVEKTVNLHEIYVQITTDNKKSKLLDIFSLSLAEIVEEEYLNNGILPDIIFVGDYFGKNFWEGKEDDFLEILINNKIKALKDFLVVLKYNFGLDLRDKQVEVYDLFKKMPRKFVEIYKNSDFGNIEDGLIWNIMHDIVYGGSEVDILKKIIFVDEAINESLKNESDLKKPNHKGLNKLSGFNGKKIERILHKLGFEEKKLLGRGKSQGKGDHKIMIRKKDGKIVGFPMHKQVKPSTLRDRLKDAGILDEFVKQIS